MVAKGSMSERETCLVIGSTTVMFGLLGLAVGCSFVNSMTLASIGFCVGVFIVAWV